MEHMGTLQGMYSVQDQLGLQQACLTNVKDERIKLLNNASCQVFLYKFCVKFTHKINLYNNEYMQGHFALKQQSKPVSLICVFEANKLVS